MPYARLRAGRLNQLMIDVAVVDNLLSVEKMAMLWKGSIDVAVGMRCPALVKMPIYSTSRTVRYVAYA